jgi:hypothetical protein
VIRRLSHDDRVFRTARATAHAARVFTAAVLFSLFLVHFDEGVRVLAPLALSALAVILAPALLERARTERRTSSPD